MARQQPTLGTAAHFEIMDSGGTTCHMQGTVTATGGGGDMEIDNTSIATGQQVTVTAFTLTAGGHNTKTRRSSAWIGGTVSVGYCLSPCDQ